jgi:hypothetical protein
VKAKDILERFMDVLSSVDQCFIADSLLEQMHTAENRMT